MHVQNFERSLVVDDCLFQENQSLDVCVIGVLLTYDIRQALYTNGECMDVLMYLCIYVIRLSQPNQR